MKAALRSSFENAANYVSGQLIWVCLTRSLWSDMKTEVDVCSHFFAISFVQSFSVQLTTGFRALRLVGYFIPCLTTRMMYCP